MAGLPLGTLSPAHAEVNDSGPQIQLPVVVQFVFDEQLRLLDRERDPPPAGAEFSAVMCGSDSQQRKFKPRMY